MAARVQAQNNMADYRMYQVPPRRPVGGGATHHAGLQFQPPEPSNPQQRLTPNFDQHSHQRSRTSSSTVLPHISSGSNYATPRTHENPHPQQQHPHLFHRQAHPAASAAPVAANHAAGPIPTRTLSNATASTSSTGGNRVTPTMSSTLSSDIHRSTSSRSVNVQLSYVALMRRQKGTVWCDRAQPEDPRLQAQKRAAKQRAYLELHGASGRSSTFASGKIRHSGKTGPSYLPSTLVGATVPLRLSANEIGDDDEDDHSSEGGPYHRRTGSVRSSLGSMHRYPSGYQRSQGKTPPNEQADIPEIVETTVPIPDDQKDSLDFSSSQPHIEEPTEDNEAHDDEHEFGGLGEMGAPAAASTAMKKGKKDDLQRRGSVDDRTTSLTGVRLFVANPDQDD